MECAPNGGQIAVWELTRPTGLSEDESHGQGSHSIEFKRQVARSLLRATLHALSRHDVSRNLIRIWVQSLSLGHDFARQLTRVTSPFNE
jgi:transposase-like protein